MKRDPWNTLSMDLNRTLALARNRLIRAKAGRDMEWFSRAGEIIRSRKIRSMVTEVVRALKKSAADGAKTGKLISAKQMAKDQIIREYEIDIGIYDLYLRCELLAKLDEIRGKTQEQQKGLLNLRERLDAGAEGDYERELEKRQMALDNLERNYWRGQLGFAGDEKGQKKEATESNILQVSAKWEMVSDTVIYELLLVNRDSHPLRNIILRVDADPLEFQFAGFFPREMDRGIQAVVKELGPGDKRSLGCCLRPIISGRPMIHGTIRYENKTGVQYRICMPPMEIPIRAPSIHSGGAQRDIAIAGKDRKFKNRRSLVVPYLFEPGELKSLVKKELGQIKLEAVQEQGKTKDQDWGIVFLGRGDSKMLHYVKTGFNSESMELTLETESSDETAATSLLIKAIGIIGPAIAQKISLHRPLKQVFVTIKDSVIQRSIMDFGEDSQGDVTIADSVVIRSSL